MGLCAAGVLTLGVYYWWAGARARQGAAESAAGIEPIAIPPESAPLAAEPKLPAETPRTTSDRPAPAAPAVPPPPPRKIAPRQLFFRYNGVDDNYGKVAIRDLGSAGPLRFADGISCEVLHFAAGRGLCLTADRGAITTYAGVLFDEEFRPGARIPLTGIPSRCRVSPDGRRAALTFFVTGHSYASVDFSTQTLLLDAVKGTILANFEEDFAVTKDGAPFKAQDFNYWGVTFTPDSKRFYCTLSSNRQHYLLTGDFAARTAKVIHDNVECPSVSPDGTRVAYKKRTIVSNRLHWQLQVLDLATGKETPLAERRSVDDQIEWLDNAFVLYAVPESETGSGATTDVWKAAADGSSAPQVFQRKAYSPVAVR